MSGKPKCSQCNERDVFSKGLCSGCYGKNWRAARKAEREAVIAEQFSPKQLTSGTTSEDSAVIEGEIVEEGPRIPETHLTAINPAEMQAAQGDLKAWLEQKLAILARDIVEANAALNEARRNGWTTTSFTAARNRAVDDETFYYKVLVAVEAGHTIIPEFPIQVFAIRRHEPDRAHSVTYHGAVTPSTTGSGQPAESDCAPAGAGEYRNPQPWLSSSVMENKAPGAQERKEPRWYTTVHRSSHPTGPITFPPFMARAPIMKATAKAMKEKVFDQIGVCSPVVADVAAAARRADTQARRAGDPLIIGQILHKRVGSKQKCVSFIIAWYLNLDEL